MDHMSRSESEVAAVAKLSSEIVERAYNNEIWCHAWNTGHKNVSRRLCHISVHDKRKCSGVSAHSKRGQKPCRHEMSVYTYYIINIYI